MKADFSTIVRGTSFLAGAILALGAASIRAADQPVAADAFPNFESYIKISGQAPSITGDKSAFQNRTQMPQNGGGGIEDLHYARDFPKDVSLQFDGHAMAGTEDYLSQLRITKNNLGSFEVGYKSFRTFYDGVGGFFPLNQEWLPLNDTMLHLDRGKFWVEGTFALPDAPVITVRYTNDTRIGQKDSTIWGDSDFTGIPNNVAPLSPARKFIPSFIDIGERTERLELSVKQTIGKTTAQLLLSGEETNNLDTRFVTRFPGEAKRYPPPAATVLVPAANVNNQILLQDGEGTNSTATTALFTTETVFNDKLTLRTHFSYQLVHAGFTGDRMLNTSTPTSAGVVPVITYNVLGLTGRSHVKEYKGNASLDYAATKNLAVKIEVKREQEYIRGDSAYNVVAASGNPAVTLATTPRVDYANITQNATTPEVEVRYTGISDLALYATASKRQLRGNENDTSSYNPLTASAGTVALNNISEDHGDYTVGGNWRQSAFLTLRAELFRKSHQDEAAGYGTGAILGDYYLLDNRFTGLKLTSIFKPTPILSFTTRYVYQSGRMQVTGFQPTYPAYDSCDAKNHTISETIDWNPSGQFYAQANVNVVFNAIGTVYPRAGIAPATSTSVAWDVNQVLQNSDNNYVTSSVILGTVASKVDDLQLQLNYYRADNPNFGLAIRTMPYGVVARDVSVTLGLKHKFSDRMIGNAKVGYIDSQNDTTGGFTNFRGPLGYVSLEYQL